MSFTSDQAIFAYASVVDNNTTDPTYIAMASDSGAAAPSNDAKVFDVTLSDGVIAISPKIDKTTLKTGDKVTFRIAATDHVHGFELFDPNLNIMVASSFYNPGAPAVERTWTVGPVGTYAYFCTNSACSLQHAQMAGSFDVGQASETDPGGKY